MNRQTGDDIPAVWVHTDGAATPLKRAVIRGGGRLVDDPAAAEAIVWAADEPDALRPRLQGGIRWVQLSAAGIEEWFAAGVIDRERIWTAAKGVYAPPIAEYVVAAILMFARRFPTAVRTRRWEPLEPRHLRGATVGILGAGLIGQEILRLLEPFAVNTLALTRGGGAVPGARRSLGPADLEELLTDSDYLVLAAPDTAETRRLLDARRLRQLEEDAVIVNVGRGTIIDTEALVEALRERTLRGAVLDVTDPEPLPDAHPLWILDNAIITAHTASTRALGAPLFARRVEENVRRYRAGLKPLGLVDPVAGY
jgi:phosphoglycerate dehydrogenase-like enzyme